MLCGAHCRTRTVLQPLASRRETCRQRSCRRLLTEDLHSRGPLCIPIVRALTAACPSVERISIRESLQSVVALVLPLRHCNCRCAMRPAYLCHYQPACLPGDKCPVYYTHSQRRCPCALVLCRQPFARVAHVRCQRVAGFGFLGCVRPHDIMVTPRQQPEEISDTLDVLQGHVWSIVLLQLGDAEMQACALARDHAKLGCTSDTHACDCANKRCLVLLD